MPTLAKGIDHYHHGRQYVMQEYQCTVTYTQNGKSLWFQHGGIAKTREEGLAAYLAEYHPDAQGASIVWEWTRPFPQEFTVCVNCTMEAGLEESFRTRDAAMRWIAKVMASPRVQHVVIYDNYRHVAHTVV